MQASLPEANPGGHVSPFSRILVPIDGSDASLRAATVAIRMAAVHALPMLAIYVVDVASLDQVGAASREGRSASANSLRGRAGATSITSSLLPSAMAWTAPRCFCAASLTLRSPRWYAIAEWTWSSWEQVSTPEDPALSLAVRCVT